MNRKTYRKIARKHGISVNEVKSEMQAAINTAYTKPNLQALNIPRKNEIPTIDEFISYAIKEVKNND